MTRHDDITLRAAEEWRPVVGYEGRYEVSSLGRVRSLPRVDCRGNRVHGGVLKPRVRGPYLCVNLLLDGISRAHNIHPLVAASFIGPRAPGFEVCHRDGCSTNNVQTNLKYASKSENECDKKAHGTAMIGARHHSAKLTESEAKEILTANESTTGLARRFGVSQQSISDIKRGTTWKHLQERM